MVVPRPLLSLTYQTIAIALVKLELYVTLSRVHHLEMFIKMYDIYDT